MIKTTIIISLLSLMCTSSFARRGKSKQLRIAACEGKVVGSECSFEGRRGEVTGSCIEGRRDTSVIICHDPERRGRMNKERD